jgi:hypothetical protein
MVDTSDPPSDERKRAEFLRRARGICRTLVNRRTFIIAIYAIKSVVRVAEIVNDLFGDF